MRCRMSEPGALSTPRLRPKPLEVPMSAEVTEKTCSRCGEMRPIDHYRWKGAGRRRSECRSCRPSEVGRFRPKDRERGLKRMYGLSGADWEAMLIAQNGVCALCGTSNPHNRYGVFEVDHDHRCCPGRKTCGHCIRGLVCHFCNVRLGWAENRWDALVAYRDKAPR